MTSSLLVICLLLCQGGIFYWFYFILGDFFSFVFLFLLFFVSLFVCLSARVHKSHKITRFHKIWWKSGARAKKILVMIQIMFYKKQSSGLGRRLVKIWYLWKYKERKITEVHVCIVFVGMSVLRVGEWGFYSHNLREIVTYGCNFMVWSCFLGEPVDRTKVNNLPTVPSKQSLLTHNLGANSVSLSNMTRWISGWRL